MDSRLPAVLPDTETILILDGHGESRDATRRSIAVEFPAARIDAVGSVSALRSRIERSRVDIVVLDHAAPEESPIELLHELRMSEHEPSVLVVSSSEDPHTIAEIYNNGCQRFIVKDGEWRPELGTVIRQALRHRKIQEQNRALHSDTCSMMPLRRRSCRLRRRHRLRRQAARRRRRRRHRRRQRSCASRPSGCRVRWSLRSMACSLRSPSRLPSFRRHRPTPTLLLLSLPLRHRRPLCHR